ncbi:serine/threonine protein kinase, partial [Frankia sp. AiPs1]|uniref:TolB family protein n=1 Tax=Frankia sp. AiPs1 TaxID=573493 RepID=UPI0035AB8E6D|nr:serine/threonine protein kinase [Frankia sp. AiPs1]
GYTADPDAPTRLPTGLGTPAQPRRSGDGTVAGQSPTRVGAEPGGSSWPGAPGASSGAGASSGPSGSGGPGAPSGSGARGRRNRGPLLVGGGVVVVGAILAGVLALNSGGDDKANDSGSSVKPATGTTAQAQPAAFTLPRSTEQLSRDTVVYASNRNGNYDLFRGDVTGDGGLQNDKPLLTGPDNDMLPAISEDRKTVVFFKKGSPNTLQAIAADGTGRPVQLFTSGPAKNLTIADDARPSLSPDGKFLVVRSSTDGTGAPNLGLYVVRLDGSSVQRLNAKPQATDPAWSPDGERIAYWSNKTGGARGFIVVISVQPNAEATPVINDSLTTDSDPVWSPTSDKIAFTRQENGDLEIFEMNSNGSDVRQLTHARGDDQDPAFGPDGRIVFSGQRDPGNPNVRQLFVLNPNDPAAGDHQLTTQGGFNGHARWNAG